MTTSLNYTNKKFEKNKLELHPQQPMPNSKKSNSLTHLKHLQSPLYPSMKQQKILTKADMYNPSRVRIPSLIQVIWYSETS